MLKTGSYYIVHIYIYYGYRFNAWSATHFFPLWEIYVIYVNQCLKTQFELCIAGIAIAKTYEPTTYSVKELKNTFIAILLEKKKIKYQPVLPNWPFFITRL